MVTGCAVHARLVSSTDEQYCLLSSKFVVPRYISMDTNIYWLLIFPLFSADCTQMESTTGPPDGGGGGGGGDDDGK